MAKRGFGLNGLYGHYLQPRPHSEVQYSPLEEKVIVPSSFV
jgi:hypothetical protein